MAMTWEMIRELSLSGLAAIGAHTINHFSLSKLSASQAEREAAQSREIILERTGVEPKHFAYPYGDSLSAGAREFAIVERLGFDTATTTRKGVLFPEHAQHLHALPRVSLNGDYQTQRYVRLFLSGVPFALRQRFRHLDVA
jgi:peptidoglycan/xylan/chitin deacetylase (PgdA/CDA1 family)